MNMNRFVKEKVEMGGLRYERMQTSHLAEFGISPKVLKIGLLAKQLCLQPAFV